MCRVLFLMLEMVQRTSPTKTDKNPCPPWSLCSTRRKQAGNKIQIYIVCLISWGIFHLDVSSLSLLIIPVSSGLEQDLHTTVPRTNLAHRLFLLNKDLLVHSHTHLCRYCLWLFLYYNDRIA